ncbi:hypothetical protein Q5P01_003550 [Channa striata]|uniref:Uncharacterized protein n=1 Tax=Channa striata TaxID=64152 RepID=A0AA88T2T6_CHASR|nr:hypothetical protein Q5P01_003550 [Channa striata]
MVYSVTMEIAQCRHLRLESDVEAAPLRRHGLRAQRLLRVHKDSGSQRNLFRVKPGTLGGEINNLRTRSRPARSVFSPPSSTRLHQPSKEIQGYRCVLVVNVWCSMVKAQKSTGRKSPHSLRRQSGGQTEMEEGQLQSDTQHSPQTIAQGGNQSLTKLHNSRLQLRPCQRNGTKRKL